MGVEPAIRSLAAFCTMAACLCLPIMAQTAPLGAMAQRTGENVGGNEVVHVLVGHSVVVRTQSRIKRVLVGNPAAVSTSTTAPNEVVMTAVAPGSSSVVLW